jgi:hypothetical protein
MVNLIEAVRAHAEFNYGFDGWDYVVECWSDEDIADAIGASKTAKGAIAKVASAIKPLAEMRDEVRAESGADWREDEEAACDAIAAQDEDEDADDWQAQLEEAARAAIAGKAAIEEGKAKGASALATVVAAFASDRVAGRPWSFDITGKNADDVHTFVRCTGLDEFGNDELAWKRNSEGKVSKDAQSAYKRAFQKQFFDLAEPNAAVWTMASKAVPLARAIREEGMTAAIEDGKLKLSGGTSDRADAMRKAPHSAALKKAIEGTSGTSRAKTQNSKGGDSEARAATPSEILAAALRLVEGVAKGDEALSGPALSFARRIATVVASAPDAFADADA